MSLSGGGYQVRVSGLVIGAYDLRISCSGFGFWVPGFEGGSKIRLSGEATRGDVCCVPFQVWGGGYQDPERTRE